MCIHNLSGTLVWPCGPSSTNGQYRGPKGTVHTILRMPLLVVLFGFVVGFGLCASVPSVGPCGPCVSVPHQLSCGVVVVVPCNASKLTWWSGCESLGVRGSEGCLRVRLSGQEALLNLVGMVNEMQRVSKDSLRTWGARAKEMLGCQTQFAGWWRAGSWVNDPHTHTQSGA